MKGTNSKQVKLGVIISYTLIILNAMYGLFLTPFIVNQLGASEYGVYKTISSLSASLVVLDLGLGATVMRYVAEYRTKQEEEKLPNFIAMSLIQAAIIAVGVAIISIFIYFLLDPLYSHGLTTSELSKAKTLYVFFVFILIVHIIENVLNGVIMGHNRFVFGNGIKVIRLISRIVLQVGILFFVQDSLAITLIDLAIAILFCLIELYYIIRYLNINIKFTYWNKSVFSESMQYTLWMFFTSIAVQVNGNFDNVIIGAISGPTFVTIYSFALLINSMFSQISTSISGVMLPTVMNILKYDEQNKTSRIESFIVKVGRIQFVLIGAFWIGFVTIGQDFISLWLGPRYIDVYGLSIILMTPLVFELSVNTCLSILRAKNMLKFRALALMGGTIFNIIFTFIGMRYWNYYAAAITTSLSTAVVGVLIMNIYYYKKFNYNMLEIYKRIFSKLWLCLLLSGIGIQISSKFLYGGWRSFILNITIFVIIYSFTLLFYGLNTEEKGMLSSVIDFRKKFIKDK